MLNSEQELLSLSFSKKFELYFLRDFQAIKNQYYAFRIFYPVS